MMTSRWVLGIVEGTASKGLEAFLSDQPLGISIEINHPADHDGGATHTEGRFAGRAKLARYRLSPA